VRDATGDLNDKYRNGRPTARLRHGQPARRVAKVGAASYAAGHYYAGLGKGEGVKLQEVGDATAGALRLSLANSPHLRHDVFGAPAGIFPCEGVRHFISHV